MEVAYSCAQISNSLEQNFQQIANVVSTVMEEVILVPCVFAGEKTPKMDNG